MALSHPLGADKWVGRGPWFGHLVWFWLVYLLKLIANYFGLVYLLKLIANYLFSLCRL